MNETFLKAFGYVAGAGVGLIVVIILLLALARFLQWAERGNR